MPRPYTQCEFQAWYLRHEKNLTQREIARLLGVSESAISQRLHHLARRHNLPISALRGRPDAASKSTPSPATETYNVNVAHPFTLLVIVLVLILLLLFLIVIVIRISHRDHEHNYEDDQD